MNGGLNDMPVRLADALACDWSVWAERVAGAPATFVVADLAYLEAEHDSDPGVSTMSRCQGRPGRPAGTGAKRRPLTTTGIIIKHNKKRTPARAGPTSHPRPAKVRLIRDYSGHPLCVGRER